MNCQAFNARPSNDPKNSQPMCTLCSLCKTLCGLCRNARARQCCKTLCACSSSLSSIHRRLWQSPTTTCASQTGYAQIASTEKLTQTHMHGYISMYVYVHMHMPACSAAQFMLAAVAYAQIVAPHYIAQRRLAYSQCRKRARDHINTHTNALRML